MKQYTEWVGLLILATQIHALIQYESLGGTALTFCLNIPIRLDLLEGSKFDWKTDPRSCQLCAKPDGKCEESKGTTVYAICKRHGRYTFEVNAENITLEIQPCQEKYRWYAQLVTKDTNGVEVVDKLWVSNNLKVRVWVVWKSHQSAEEKKAIALRPATAESSSIYLTRSLHRRGLRPTLTTYFRDQTDLFFFCSKHDLPTFDEQGAFWEFSCNKTLFDRYGSVNNESVSGAPMPRAVPTFQQKIKIGSNSPVDLMGYTVSDALRTFSRTKFVATSSGTPGTQLDYTDLAASAPVIRYNPCNPSSAVVLCGQCRKNADGTFRPELLISHDEFLTASVLSATFEGGAVPKKLFDFAVIKTDILLLTDVGLFGVHKDEKTWTAKSVKIPEGTWKSIKSAEWCTTGSISTDRDLIFLVSESNVAMGRVENYALSADILNIPESVKVMDASPDPVAVKSQLMILVKDAKSNKLQVYIVGTKDPSDKEWSWETSGHKFGSEVDLSNLALKDGADSRKKIRSTLIGQAQALVTVGEWLFTVEENNKQTNSKFDDVITQLLTTDTGHRYYTTKKGSTFHRVRGSQEQIKLYTASESKDGSESFIWIDRYQRPVYESIKVEADGTVKVDKQNLDLGTELMNSVNSNEVNKCPFTLFVVNGTEKWYQIDASQSFRISAELWTKKPSDGKLESAITLSYRTRTVPHSSRNKPLVVKHAIKQEIVGDLVRSTILLQISNPFTVHNSSGLMVPLSNPNQVTSISVVPSKSSPHCTQPVSTATLLQAACPAGTSIGLIPQFPCNNSYPMNFTVPKEYLHRPDQKQPFVISRANLPCESPYYGDLYKPKLGLYYFDQLMEEVPVDYYLFELNWRKDFTYNSTEIDMGCVIQAQNLVDMSEKHQKTVIDIGADGFPSWGPGSYISCYQNKDGHKAPSAGREYEILNSTSSNSIRFTRNHTTVYVFVAQILNPNYSFCNLNTTFVVVPHGYGDMPDPLSPVYAWIASCILCILFFWSTYYVYAVSWNENRVGFDMMQKAEQPAAWHLLTAGEKILIRSSVGDAGKFVLPKEAKGKVD